MIDVTTLITCDEHITNTRSLNCCTSVFGSSQARYHTAWERPGACAVAKQGRERGATGLSNISMRGFLATPGPKSLCHSSFSPTTTTTTKTACIASTTTHRPTITTTRRCCCCCMVLQLIIVTLLKQQQGVRLGAALATVSPFRKSSSSSSSSHRLSVRSGVSLLRETINGENSASDSSSSSSRKRARQENSPKGVPETGWNHNLPSQDSPFWNGPNQEAPSSRRQQSSSFSTNNNKSDKLRTGWLHNTQSRSTSMQSSQNKQQPAAAASPLNMARRRLEWAQWQQIRNHRILSAPVLHAAGEDKVVAVTEHVLSVPLQYNNNNNNNNSKQQQQQQRIDVYFTIVEKIESESQRQFLQNELSSTTSLTPQQRAERYVSFANLSNADGMVLYLQGGPGFGAPVPGVSLMAPATASWAGAALWTHNYQRVVLLDPRGTGQSTPVTKQTLQQQYPDLFLLDVSSTTAATSSDIDLLEQNSRSLADFQSTQPDRYARVQDAVERVTHYLAQFRADHIVADAEYIREALMVPNLEEPPPSPEPAAGSESPPPRIRPWGCSLGQSYGGFCSMAYMSRIAHPPRIMLLTGGIAPMLDADVTETYRSLWEQCRERNYRYYEMYPSDVPLVGTIVQRLLREPVPLPSGGRLTARRFLSLGIGLGGSPSAFASLHNLLSTALVGGVAAAAASTTTTTQQKNNISDVTFTRAFLKRMDSEQSFDDHPIYFWLHESIYADGPRTNNPTNWAAHRAYERLMQEDPNVFDYRQTSLVDSDGPTLFFGEHVFPWMPEDYAELSGVGLRAVADALARKSNWGPLYNADHMKMVHSTGRTRSAAAVYVEDMYVAFDSSRRVAAREGPLGQCKLYVTNEYQHSGLRDNGAVLFSKLHGMAKEGTRTPS